MTGHVIQDACLRDCWSKSVHDRRDLSRVPSDMLRLSAAMMPQRKSAPSKPTRTTVRGLHQIRIGPASEKASGASSYVSVAPLDDDSRIDVRLWKEMRSRLPRVKICADNTVRPGTLFRRAVQTGPSSMTGGPSQQMTPWSASMTPSSRPARSVWLTEHGIRAEYRVVSLVKVWS